MLTRFQKSYIWQTVLKRLFLREAEVISRDSFAEALLAEGIKSEGYCPIPIHLQAVIKDKVGYGKTKCPFDCPWYGEKVTYRKGLCPKAEKLSSQDLLLPVYETFTEKDLKDVVTALAKVASNTDRLWG
jgi:dTDP-4-amino-4,6-dideoxygalactose transaminase